MLVYALGLLAADGLVGYRSGSGAPEPLLFKGGTALRKCVFGSTGRFSQDIDLDAVGANGFEDQISDLFDSSDAHHDITFEIDDFRHSSTGNFSGRVAYTHPDNAGRFELQVSYRLQQILDGRDLVLERQGYFSRLEISPPTLYGLDPYEMIGEKIMACNRRQGGSGKDVYDLFLWSRRPFDADLARRIAVLKAWTDQRQQPRYAPDELLAAIQPANFRWEDIAGLVPRQLDRDPAVICEAVRERLSFLADIDPAEQTLLDDQTAHRETALFDELRTAARVQAETVSR